MIAGIAAFAIVIGSPPVPPVPAPVAAAPASLTLPTTTVEFPLAEVVGPVRAGLLCLPRGKARGRDFLRSPKDLTLLVQQAASDANAVLPANLQIGFTSLRVKLCVRSWGAFGIGHSDALSGDAEFVFAWSVGAPSPAARQMARIRIEIGKDQATSPDAILRAALDRLIVEIRQKSDHHA